MYQQIRFLFLLLFFALSSAQANVKTGNPAPNFALPSAKGKSVELKHFRGKTVVLEWKNHGCPFVKKHYNSKNMQKLQKKYGDKGVVWLSIISSAPGKQGYSSPDQALEDIKNYHASPTEVLIDSDGRVGRLYGAMTTPHMFVINDKGLLVYQGAIDNNDSSDPDDVATAKNYVQMALDSTLKHGKIPVSETEPYGCSVKYK